MYIQPSMYYLIFYLNILCYCMVATEGDQNAAEAEKWKSVREDTFLEQEKNLSSNTCMFF